MATSPLIFAMAPIPDPNDDDRDEVKSVGDVPQVIEVSDSEDSLPDVDNDEPTGKLFLYSALNYIIVGIDVLFQS